jgi:hypothetical protein
LQFFIKLPILLNLFVFRNLVVALLMDESENGIDRYEGIGSQGILPYIFRQIRP